MSVKCSSPEVESGRTQIIIIRKGKIARIRELIDTAAGAEMKR